jgi:KDO2-lipid IV(A) lauroyltransferase
MKLRYVVEYVLFRFVAGLFCHIPYRVALFVGWCLAWCSFHILHFRTKEAKRRIKEVFAERFSAREINEIAWKSWRNFMFTIVEMIRIPVSTRNWMENIADIHREKHDVFRWRHTGRGGIIASAHSGSWEMAAALFGKVYDVPIFSIAAPQKNKLIDDYLYRVRVGAEFGSVIRNASVLKNILRQIKSGKILAILPDVRGKTDALPIKFLGKTANIAGGMGFIARHANVPVFPVIITRIGWGHQHYFIPDPIFPDLSAEKEADALRITQSFFDILTECITAEPEQWFWFNKRWIFDPLTP